MRSVLLGGFWGRLAAVVACGIAASVSVIFVGAQFAGAQTPAVVSASTAPTLAIASSQTEADGIRLEFNIPGFIASNTLIDFGGPDSQASVNEQGETGGGASASFPYTGQLGSVLTLVEGLGSGHLPSFPPLPGQVSADYPNTPSASQTQGPYLIQAHADQSDASSSATFGGQLLSVGSALQLSSTSSVTENATSLIATSTATIGGLQIGPAAIGQVISTATETLGADGKVTPSTSITLSGLQVPGFPGITVTPSGVSLFGVPINIPIGQLLDSVVSGAGFKVSISKPQSFTGGGVEAPAMIISGPVTVPGFSAGTFTLTLGGATATISAAGAGGFALPSGNSSLPSESSGQPLAPLSLPGASLSNPSYTPVGSTGTSSPGSGSGVSPESPSPIPKPSPGPRLTVASTANIFDLRGLYLALALATVIALGGATMVRCLGVRGPWKRS